MKSFNGQKFLTAYSGVLTVGVAVALLSGFTDENGNPRFDTITVQRINVVEPDGKLRMVLTNNNRIPGVIVNGHEYADYGRRKPTTAAGILFYDAAATESGGLTFGGRDGGPNRFGHLSFDRHNQDQMFAISARDDGTNYSSEIRFIDQPNWNIKEFLDFRDSIAHLPEQEQNARILEFLRARPIGAGSRTVLSSNNIPQDPSQSSTTLSLGDLNQQQGDLTQRSRPRTRLSVAPDGTPSLEMLDEAGNVTDRFPSN
jgi:hypothetical protein